MKTMLNFFAPKKRKEKAASDENESSSSPTNANVVAVKTKTNSAPTNQQENPYKRPKKEPTPVGAKASAAESTTEKEQDPVSALLQFLNESSNTDDASWRKALEKHFASKNFEKLAKFVASQRKSATIYPAPCDVFSALTLTPLDTVKVVIVGQDPYHGPNQGHGLCFSVRKGVPVPPSLKNIYKELNNDPNVDFPHNNSSLSMMPTHGYLERWARQGVLMLNAVLTVRRGEANSHKSKGWENVTDEILRVLAKHHKTSGKGLVYLLWGKPAAKKIETVLGGQNSQSKTRVIISTSHPSPLGATKTNAPFLGSKCFSRANEALVEMGLQPIDWNVDGELPTTSTIESDKAGREGEKVLVDV